MEAVNIVKPARRGAAVAGCEQLAPDPDALGVLGLCHLRRYVSHARGIGALTVLWVLVGCACGRALCRGRLFAAWSMIPNRRNTPDCIPAAPAKSLYSPVMRGWMMLGGSSAIFTVHYAVHVRHRGAHQLAPTQAAPDDPQFTPDPITARPAPSN